MIILSFFFECRSQQQQIKQHHLQMRRHSLLTEMHHTVKKQLYLRLLWIIFDFYLLPGDVRNLRQECYTSQRLRSGKDSNLTYILKADHEFYCSNSAPINHKVTETESVTQNRTLLVYVSHSATVLVFTYQHMNTYLSHNILIKNKNLKIWLQLFPNPHRLNVKHTGFHTHPV